MKKNKIVSKCCVCGRVRRKSEDSHDISTSHLDQWGYHDEELERYYEDYDLVHSHGYCPECARKTEQEFMQWIKSQTQS